MRSRRALTRASARGAKNPPSLRVRMDDALWDQLHRFPEVNWSEVCRGAMWGRIKALGGAVTREKKR